MHSANVLLYWSRYMYIMEGKHVKLKLKLGQIANRNKKKATFANIYCYHCNQATPSE